MPGRLDPRPLFLGLTDGLRKRKASGDEPADVWSRVVVIGAPLAVAGVLGAFGFEFSAADQLLAGTALLAGALLTGFAQVASWRERILSRHRNVDGVDVRALNEAAAHVLVSLLASLLATILVIVLANLNLYCASFGVHLAARILSAATGAVFTYIVISLLIVTNLLWDAFQNEEREAQREGVADSPQESAN